MRVASEVSDGVPSGVFKSHLSCLQLLIRGTGVQVVVVVAVISVRDLIAIHSLSLGEVGLEVQNVLLDLVPDVLLPLEIQVALVHGCVDCGRLEVLRVVLTIKLCGLREQLLGVFQDVEGVVVLVFVEVHVLSLDVVLLVL